MTRGQNASASLHLLTLLVLGLLLVPSVGAACTSLGCVNFVDEDEDGTPEGVIGGTAPAVHDGPTVSFLVNESHVIVAHEASVGDDDAPGGILLRGDVFVHRNETRVERIVVDESMQWYDGSTGRTMPILEGWIVFYDGDKDETVDTWACHVEPQLDETNNASAACRWAYETWRDDIPRQLPE